MKRLLFLLLVLFFITIPAAQAGAPDDVVPYVNRARIVMDLLKDGNVTAGRLANYADTELDYASGPFAITYADAFCIYFGEHVDGTNPEKAAFFIKKLRTYCKAIRKQVLEREQDAANTAANQTTIDSEMGTDDEP